MELATLLDEGEVKHNGQVLQDFLCEGGTFQDAFGFTDDVMRAKYEIAYDYYQKKEYEQAISAFSYLTNLNPYIHKYWQALAAAQVRCKFWLDAINSYNAAALIEPNDPNPQLYSGHCFLELNQINEAIEAFKATIRIASRNHLYREIEEKAQEWLNKLLQAQ
jgi:type III secretion system low calcium response chaperone LcrH/SycD